MSKQGSCVPLPLLLCANVFVCVCVCVCVCVFVCVPYSCGRGTRVPCVPHTCEQGSWCVPLPLVVEGLEKVRWSRSVQLCMCLCVWKQHDPCLRV